MPDLSDINIDVKNEILHRIRMAEQEHNVKVLFAVESGSRAWGFSSPNSDFDVRFIYAHPQAWYLDINVEGKRDVIEYPIVDEIDINGWDIRKALVLFSKSNPTIVEWIKSPIVYVDDGFFAGSLRALLPDIYGVHKGIYHYRHMAQTNYQTHINKPEVSLKKYLYILRALLSIKWLEQKREPAPIEFDVLRMLVAGDKPLTEAISALLARKKKSHEKEIGLGIPELNAFIEDELKRLSTLKPNDEKKEGGTQQLNVLFQKILIGE